MPRIISVRFGWSDYARGRPDLLWEGNRFRFAALVAMLRADDGSFGIGVGWSHAGDEHGYAAVVQAALAEAAIGRDATQPFATATHVGRLARGIGQSRAAAVLDLALFDLAGRAQAVPACQLLGCRRPELPAYVISAEEFGFTAPSQFVALAQRYVAAGFRGCKFHLWGDRERDIAACRAIRDAVGPDIALMLDPAGRYAREDALFVGRAIAELGFVRFEDPLPPADLAGYRWLAPRIDVPIMGNESLRWSFGDCARAAAEHAVHGFRCDVGRSGLAQALAFSAVAEAHGAEFDCAAFAPRGGLEACLHMNLAAPTARWFEYHEALGHDEVPGLAPGLSICDGVARPSGRPGLGFEVDVAEFERRCRWAPK